MRPDPERLAEVVEQAFELEGKQRADFIAEASGENEELRGEAEALLAEQERAEKLMARPAIEFGAELMHAEGPNTGELRPGERLGDYQVLCLLGEGGMGEVYLAEDTKLGRRVAIKLIKSGFGTKAFIRRFQQEERILAGLNHPNIARLYGGGVTAKGLPYFVMEYAEGIPLTVYAQAHSLAEKEKLALFRKVCGAVTYAHQNLVLHRDLKPANIRVTQDDEPKLLDFGIARLLDPATAEADNQTLLTNGVMTPDYASPEQRGGERMTTASDVYSLGIVLHELLAGEKPIRRKEGEPEVRKLGSDLDNIVAKALRTEPERRYASVGQFSEDIRRYLEGLPIIARKDTVVYRTSKFVRRHPFGVAAAVLILISLIGGMMTTSWQAQAARREKARTEKIENFLERTLNYSDPNLRGQNGRETTIVDVLDEAAKRLEQEDFSGQPEIKAELERIVAQSYYSQGKYHWARRHNEKFVAEQSKLSRSNEPLALEAAAVRAGLLFDAGKLKDSERLFRAVLPLVRVEVKKGAIKPGSLANACNSFAFARRTQGDSREAEALFREALALNPQMSTDEWRSINGTTRSTLASTLADQGRFQEALQMSREAVAEYRQRKETGTSQFGFALTVFGGFLTDNGDYAEADANLAEADAIQRKFLGRSDLWLGDNLRNQAMSFYEQGRYAESLEKVKETLKIYLENFGPHYDNYPTALIIEGLSLVKTGHVKEGEDVLREAVKIRTELLPKEHYWVALAKSALGECLTLEHRYREAEPLLAGSYESLKRSQGANNPRTRLALRRVLELSKRREPDLAAKHDAP